MTNKKMRMQLRGVIRTNRLFFREEAEDHDVPNRHNEDVVDGHPHGDHQNNGRRVHRDPDKVHRCYEVENDTASDHLVRDRQSRDRDSRVLFVAPSPLELKTKLRIEQFDFVPRS
ncbi:hypothetical protein PAPYR_2399 [Paratrimastix pyriformis]|uniref:Uncharacterized protein n=1 Tax=Paratrimastix pyriformis TaxID=342808 RepID=A0ABQ8USB3_9EUKA|nr:hypothetical protein PAPYR_2399 [Paratrimastix pyriformis]